MGVVKIGKTFIQRPILSFRRNNVPRYSGYSDTGRNPQVAKFKKLALSRRIWIPVFTGMTVNLTTPVSTTTTVIFAG